MDRPGPGDRQEKLLQRAVRHRWLWLTSYTSVASLLIMGFVSLSGDLAPTLGSTVAFAIQGFVLVALAVAAGLLANDVVGWLQSRLLAPEPATEGSGGEHDCRCEYNTPTQRG